MERSVNADSAFSRKKSISSLFGKLKYIKGGIWLSVSFSFMLCIFAPLEYFIANRSDFWFDIYDLLPYAVLSFVGLALINIAIFVLLRIISIVLYRWGLLFEFVGFVMSYIYGNFLSGSLPGLEGGLIDWSEYVFDIWLSRGLWVCLIVLFFVLVWKFHFVKVISIIRYISMFMIGVFALTLVIEIFTRGGSVLSKNRNVVATDMQLMDMSTDKNVIILLMDMLDSTVTNDIIANNSEYAEAFSDFTYYRNTSGGYDHTKESLPLIISGRWYENKGDFSGFSTSCFKDSEVLKKLDSEGFILDWYGNITYNDDSVFRFQNRKAIDTRFNSRLYFWSLFAKLVGLKYGPYFIKQDCVVSASAFDEKLRVSDTKGYELHSSKLLNFYNRLENGDFALSDNRYFKFIHLEGAHQGYDITADLEVLEDMNGTYEQKCEAALKVAMRYIQELKDNGIYDNTALVIMADHGNKDIRLGCDPLFMVKGFDEHHEFNISDAPVSFGDVSDSFIKLIDGSSSTELFDWKEGDSRDRRFLFYYEFFDNDHLIEYNINGSVLDDDAIKETGNVLVRTR